MSSRPSSVLTAPGYGDAVRAWYDAADVLLEPWRKARKPERSCGCEDADRCRCGPCDCCIPDADVLVHARAGERRVVPLQLRNPGRRPLTATIDVGPFTPCGAPGTVQVESRVLPGTELQLAACESRTVQVVVELAGAGERERERKEQERCESFVADIRFGGCGSRAVRVGMVVLPAQCDAYEVRCDCGCC